MKIIAIDFDGTIVEDCYPQIGLLKPGVAHAIKKMRVMGHYIIINTCRQSNELVDAINFLIDNDIYFDRINDNHPSLIAKYGNTRKIHADVFIDANNIGGIPEWSSIVTILNNEL